MPTLKFEVPAPYAEWIADGVVYRADKVHNIENAPAELVKLASVCHEQGVLIVHEGFESGHVESDEDSLAANAAAVASGAWHEGQLLQSALDHVVKEQNRLAEAAVAEDRAAMKAALVEEGMEEDQAHDQAILAYPAEPENITVDPADVKMVVRTKGGKPTMDADGKVKKMTAADVLALYEGSEGQ